MLDKAVSEYFGIIKGETPAGRWLFVVTFSLLFSIVSYVIFNFDGKEYSTINLSDSTKLFVPFNSTRLFIFLKPSHFNIDQFLFGHKIVEFMVLWLVLSLVVSLSYDHFRQNRLRDALSPVRDKLYGNWILSIEDFDISQRAPFDLDIEIGSTVAEKLLVIIRNDKIYGIVSESAHVSLTVGDGNSRIEISFPIQSNVSIAGNNVQIFFYISLWHLALPRSKGITFHGKWFSISDLGDQYNVTGSCSMSPQP